MADSTVLRYPVDNWPLWYDATPFKTKTSYGYHEGADINLKTGGNSDLGQPLYAIADGEVTSIELLTTGFGQHIHIKHTGPWGVVWCHYAHCKTILVKVGDHVKMGQKIAEVGHTGNSRDINGNPVAHCHWAIKLEPTGINAIAKTLVDLKKWTNPIEFVQKWMAYTPTPVITPPLVISDQLEPLLSYYKVKTSAELIGMVDQQLAFLKDERDQNKTLQETADQRKKEYNDFITEMAQKLALPTTSDKSDIMGAVGRLLEVENQRDEAVKKLKNEQEAHQKDVSGLNQELRTLRVEMEAEKQKMQAKYDNLLTRLEKAESQTQVVTKQSNFFTDFLKSIFK